MSPNPKVPLLLDPGSMFEGEEALSSGSQMAHAQSSQDREGGMGCCVHPPDGHAQGLTVWDTGGHLACLQYLVPTGDVL